MFEDDLSRVLYDKTLILRMAGYEKYLFSRFSYSPFYTVVEEKEFNADNLPKDILGTPLKIFKFRSPKELGGAVGSLISGMDFFEWVNGYRQYLISRDGYLFSPPRNGSVLDCGACIGDMSVIFANIVGPDGQVHIFDPVPLHNKYISLQTQLNPELNRVFYQNCCAVGKYTTNINRGWGDDYSDVNMISPGGLWIDDFSMTNLDDYVSGLNRKVDYVKMDIEGFELDALAGAENFIRSQSPMLAISIYHKPDDIWEIPLYLKKINPTYKYYYGHHSFVSWESVVYAR